MASIAGGIFFATLLMASFAVQYDCTPKCITVDNLIFSDGITIYAEILHDEEILSSKTMTVGANSPVEWPSGGWKVCVGALVESPDSFFSVQPHEYSQGNGMSGDSLVLPFSLENDNVKVRVNSLVDSVSNASSCAAGSTGSCNFRSAVDYCTFLLNFPECLVCVVELPSKASIEMNPSLGEITVIDINGSLWIEGNGCTVSPANTAQLNMRLLKMEKSIQSESTFSFRMSNLTVESFGSVADLNGGAVYIGGLTNVVVQDCVFTYCSGYSGGSIYLTNTADIDIARCLFFENDAGMGGGAVYLNEANSRVHISNSTFSSTSSVKGGSLYANTGNFQLRISHSEFRNSYASESGGAIYLETLNDELVVFNCSFDGTTAEEDGGAIYVFYDNDQLSINNCTFTDAYAHNGASIYSRANYQMNLFGSVFKDSSARYGGAIYYYEGNDRMFISHCLFTDLSVIDEGGAIYVHTDNGWLNIVNCIFTAVSAFFDGGAIFVLRANLDLLISECVFSDTSGSAGGALYLYTENDGATVSDCLFSFVSAGDGGAVYIYSDNDAVTIQRCKFIESVADALIGSGGKGGAVYAHSSNSNIEIEDSVFSKSLAVYGGALYFSLDNNGLKGISVKNSLFEACAASYGGAIYIGSAHVATTLQSVIFRNNSAAQDGGALLCQDSNSKLKVSRCVFEGNTASRYGGGMAAISGNTGVSVVDSSFARNIADSGGGAIQSSLANSDFEINSCTFKEHYGEYGGTAYFGNDHDGISISDTSVESGEGAYGGAFYITQFNEGVVLTSSVLSGNIAREEGGAVYALAVDVLVTDCHILNNSASSSAAMYLRVKTIAISSCVLAGNVAHASYGGLRLEDTSFVDIHETQFIGNKASESGSGLSAINCMGILVRNCRFQENNSTRQTGGAVLFLRTSNATVFDSDFIDNFAGVSGGAIQLLGDDSVNISNCNFRGNSVDKSSGSALWISETSNTVVASNTFSRNSALNGGGTVFWEAASVSWFRSEQLLAENAFWDDNVALYGNSVATDAFALSLDSGNNYEISDYTSSIPPAGVYIVDYYRQIVRTESSSVVVASVLSGAKCYKSAGYVKGGSVEQVLQGSSNFTSLFAYCDPGYHMTINITCAAQNGAFLSAGFDLSFRECVRGEYYGDRSCFPCEDGTYSVTEPSETSLEDLRQSDVCIKCPAGSSDCYEDVVSLKEDFWRISDVSTTPLSCPFKGSCKGGVASGEFLCRNGYTGPVCAVCEDGYSFRSATQSCEACSKSSWLDAYVIVLICAVCVVMGFAGYILSRKGIKDKVKTMDDLYVLVLSKLGVLSSDKDSDSLEHEDSDITLKANARAAVRSFQVRFKIYVTLWQIISVMPFTLDIRFPDVYTIIASGLSIFNMSISRSSLITCSSNDGYDAIDALVVDTVYPVVVVILLWTFQVIHVYSVRQRSRGSHVDVSRIRSPYFAAFLVFTYIILPSTSVQIFQTFSCRDVDPDNVENGDDRFMSSDYSVSCSSSKYQFGLVWAVVCVFLYPVGIPLYYFYLLWSARGDIESRNSQLSPADNNARILRLQPLRLLFEYYKPKLWYWEMVETLNRLMLTGVLVLVEQGSAVQIIVGVALSLFFLKFCDVFKPFADSDVQLAKEISQWQILVVFFLALLLKADFGSVNKTAIGVCLVLALVANITIDVVHLVWNCLVGRVAEKGDSSTAGPTHIELPIVSKGETSTVFPSNDDDGQAQSDIELDSSVADESSTEVNGFSPMHSGGAG